MGWPEVKQIIHEGKPGKLRVLFGFTKEDTPERIILKFNLWARYFFVKYFSSPDAPFHQEMDLRRVRLYLGKDTSFLNIAFRDSAKTTRAKLFRAFVIANDNSHYRKYLRVLSKELGNAKQTVTDIYNMLVSVRVRALYPEIFEKTITKREETMMVFKTSTGIMVAADSVGTDKRGEIQEESRPDFDLYDDFETRLSLMSAVTTNKIWINMEEARTGLSKDGSSEYMANYISERGNVHKLIEKIKNQMIIPIIKNGVPTWGRFTLEDIKRIKQEADDFEGEYLCKPNASKDVYFDREALDKMPIREPIKDIAGFKIYRAYNAAHRYAGGHDVAGGVGLDSSASVFIDFDTIPAQVVGTYKSNTILPEAFGDEIYSQGNRFGGCLLGVENNRFDQAILKAKQLGAKLFMTPGKAIKAGFQTPTTYGWQTNSLTKSQMLSSLREAIEAGLIELNDPDLINETRVYTRNDLIDLEPDVRLATQHFDLLVALCIAWQMKDKTRVKVKEKYPGSAEKEVNQAI
jgi:hypothetical protein